MTIIEIEQEARDLVDADTTSYPAATLLRRVNFSIETLVSKIIQVCRNYPYDDENFGNIAQGTIILQEGISKYTITDRFLDILEVKVKDNSGYWHIVKPITQNEDSAIVETQEAETGLPTKYRIVGRTIFLRVAPTASSVTLSAGLKFSYTRTSYQITSDDVNAGTLIPGIASPWHITVSKMAALPYAKTFKKDRVTQLQLDIQNDIYGQEGLLAFYGSRLKDKDNRMVSAKENNK